MIKKGNFVIYRNVFERFVFRHDGKFEFLEQEYGIF